MNHLIPCTYQITVENPTQEETTDQPRLDDVLPGWDGEGRGRERQEGFAATIVRLIKDQRVDQQNAINYLQSSYDARILERNDTVNKLAEENKGLRELLAEQQKLASKTLDKLSIVEEKLKESERCLEYETSCVHEAWGHHDETKQELKNVKKELKDTQDELCKYKAEKATTEIAEQLADLKKQLADLQRGAQKSTRPTTASPALTKPSTPKSAQTSRPAWK